MIPALRFCNITFRGGMFAHMETIDKTCGAPALKFKCSCVSLCGCVYDVWVQLACTIIPKELKLGGRRCSCCENAMHKSEHLRQRLCSTQANEAQYYATWACDKAEARSCATVHAHRIYAAASSTAILGDLTTQLLFMKINSTTG